MNAAVIAGTFADLKTVKTRGVVQLVVEVPIERAASVVEAFGFPQPGEEIPVAVARLVASPGPRAAAEPSQPAADKRKWDGMPMSQRAALLCQDDLFASYLADRRPDDWDAAGCQATPTLRRICGVRSRADLNTDQAAAARFERLCRDFWRWKNEPVA